MIYGIFMSRYSLIHLVSEASGRAARALGQAAVQAQREGHQARPGSEAASVPETVRRGTDLLRRQWKVRP